MTQAEALRVQALTRKIARRISRRWPHLDNDTERDDIEQSLWFEAEKLWHRHDENYGNTYEEYATPILCAHATDWARSRTTLIAPKSRDYRDVVVGVGGAYDCDSLPSEEYDDGSETCRPKSQPRPLTVDPVDTVEHGEVAGAVHAIAAELADPDILLLAELANGAAPKDLAAEMYGATTQREIQLVAKRRDRAIERLRRDENLRDLYARRFGRDKLQLDYGHSVEEATTVDQPSATADRAQGPARSEGPPFSHPTARAASLPASVSPEPPGVASHKAASPVAAARRRHAQAEEPLGDKGEHHLAAGTLISTAPRLSPPSSSRRCQRARRLPQVAALLPATSPTSAPASPRLPHPARRPPGPAWTPTLRFACHRQRPSLDPIQPYGARHAGGPLCGRSEGTSTTAPRRGTAGGLDVTVARWATGPRSGLRRPHSPGQSRPLSLYSRAAPRAGPPAPS